MLSNNKKRLMTLLIALAAVLILLPVMALGAQTDAQAAIDDILTRYLGATVLPEEEIREKVSRMDWETYQTARWEISELEGSDEIQSLTETELQALLSSNQVFCTFSDVLELRASTDKEVTTLATTVTVLDGQVSVTDTQDNVTVSSGTVTATAKGGLFSQKTNTLTITNNSGSKATISFDYTASNYRRFSESSASGSKSLLLDAGASITMSITGKAALSGNTATLKLSNFSLVIAKDVSSVTIQFDSTAGSVTANGAAVSSGAEVEGSLTEAVALVATPANSATFYGWINADSNEVLSPEQSYTINPASDITVKPLFFKNSSSECLWAVSGATTHTASSGFLGFSSFTYYTVNESLRIFEDLNAAATYAGNATVKYIVLLKNGTLTAGNYSIPAGVTLLIPFDSANTLYTSQAQTTGDDGYLEPTRYRTLTLADGANLTINGTMSLSGKHNRTTASNYSGNSPSGPTSFVDMQGSSKITVNGSLYAYGYITGSGSVEVNDGGKVYELFQVADFRGGTQTTDMDNRVFPMSQYYVQNVEVPMTLNYGCTVYCYATIYMSSTEFGTAPVLIGKGGGMFSMSPGSVVTKRYDGATDRLIVDVTGTLAIDQVSISASGKTVNSADYVLPITNNATVTIKSGSSASISNDIAVLPGAKIIIEEGATVTVASGKNMYIYDLDQWGAFCGSANQKLMNLKYVPGRTNPRTEADLTDAMIQVDGTLDVSAGNCYTTAGTPLRSSDGELNWNGGGANICSTGAGKVIISKREDTYTYQLIQGDVSKVPTAGYYQIPVTTAKLKNADGSYTLHNGSTTDPNTYTYIDGFWRCATHSWNMENYKCSVCSEPAIRYDAINLSIEGEVKLNLKFKIADQLINEGLVVHVSEQENFVDTDGDSWENTVTSEFLDKKDNTRYVIQQGIAAGEMPGNVTVYFTHGENTVPIGGKDNTNATTAELTQSVKDYLVQGLNSDKQTLKELCKWTAIYGGYAQEFFKTDKDYENSFVISDLVDDRTVDSAKLTQQATISGSLSGISAYTQRINLDSEIYMRTYFLLSEGQSIGNFEFKLTDTPDSTSYFVGPEHDSDNKYYVDIKNIPVASWNDMYTITVSNDSGSITVTSSVLAWAARCVSSTTASEAQKNMAMAMGYYAEAADNYFP